MYEKVKHGKERRKESPCTLVPTKEEKELRRGDNTSSTVKGNGNRAVRQ